MAIKKTRIVLDTNILLSFLISKRHIQIDTLLKTEKVELVFSEELLHEFLEVINRPKFRNLLKQDDINELLGSLHGVSTVVKVTSSVKKCRDAKDNFLLALCKDSKANYLITGDDDLLVLKQFEKTRIIKYTEIKKEIS